MTSVLTRTGDIVSLDGFHHDMLTSMLDEDVPETLTVDQARLLVNRVRDMCGPGVRYTGLLEGFLGTLDALLKQPA